MHTMKNGYGFKFVPDEYMEDEDGWYGSPSDAWEIGVYTVTGNEQYLGTRRIDGTLCAAFDTQDGIWAQSAVMTQDGDSGVIKANAIMSTDIDAYLGQRAGTAANIGGVLLGVVGLGVLGVAGYMAFRKTTPAVAATGALGALKSPVVPAPKPATSPRPISKPAAAPAAAPVAAPAAAAPVAAQAAAPTIGQRVQAQWTDGRWYPGRVNGRDSSGRYEIAWDDGAAPTWVRANQVTSAAAAPAAAAPAAAVTDPRAAALGDCFTKGGAQLDQEGNCWDGDRKV